MRDLIEILRIAGVIALVCVAAALATPKGRLPLALRGLAKLLDSGRAGSMTPPDDSASQGDLRSADARRFRRNRPTRALAFLLVILAIILALI